MSEQNQQVNVANIPEAERVTGSDPLFLELNPSVRAFYSARPGFTDGADTDIYPHESLLRRPEIAEALEQAHLARISQHPERATPTAKKQLDKVDIELAFSGLTWLQTHLHNGSPLRRTFNGQHDLLSPQVAQRQEIQRRRDESLAQFRAEQREKEEQEHTQRAHETLCEEEMTTAIDSGRKRFPDMNFNRLLKLRQHLYSREESDGTIVVSESKKFRKEVESQADEYLEDPGAMVEDFTGIMVLHIAAEDGPSLLRTVQPYTDKLEAGLIAATEGRTYPDLTEDIMDRWFSLLDALDPAYQTNPGVDADPQKRNLAVSTFIGARSHILADSLIALSRKDPHHFIDRLYTFAGKGLPTENLAKREATLGVIERCLMEPLVYHQLMRGVAAASILGISEDLPAVRQALDLETTLEGFTKIVSAVEDQRQPLAALSDAEMQLVDSVCSHVIGAEAARREISAAAGNLRIPRLAAIHNFREMALTPEGRSTTLYGRVSTIDTA